MGRVAFIFYLIFVIFYLLFGAWNLSVFLKEWAADYR